MDFDEKQPCSALSSIDAGKSAKVKFSCVSKPAVGEGEKGRGEKANLWHGEA